MARETEQPETKMALWGRSDCGSGANGGENFFQQEAWCGAPGNSYNQEWQCWLPYEWNGSKCYPQNKNSIGQWNSGGHHQKGGSTNYLSTSGAGGVHPNTSQPGPYNTGGLAVAVGAPIGGAAVLGMVLFNRKRNMKKAKATEGVELSAPGGSAV